MKPYVDLLAFVIIQINLSRIDKNDGLTFEVELFSVFQSTVTNIFKY